MAYAWYTVAFHIVTALNSGFILGYPALIMAYLGWTAGVLCLLGGGIISFYKNCLLGELHETGGKRQVRYRDLAGHIYAAAFTVGRHVTLPGWVGVAGAVICVFAFLVPTLHAFRFFSTCSLLLSCVYIFTSVGIALTDGVKAKFSRDYSLKGSNTEKAFNALGAMATIAFAFNTGILPEMQATVKEPSVRNMKKALDLQFTVGTLPILMLTFVGYWAYGNDVVPYMLNSVSGPKSAVTVANAAAFLQTVVSLHIYCSHIYEFMDTSFSKKGRHEWSFYSITVRLIKRTTYISLSTFLGALLLFFGDFIVLTGAVAVFPPESGLVHHMYTKRLIWHWGMVIISAALTVGTVAVGFRFIVVDSINYPAFADL
uniref:Amino acid transporter transmembrane domain-containing protein n=1 Tax=Physcomitrium patens TaxID=3218 RepID=A0A2K1IRW6_PHYPA|nr:hypothetical protein PHYPA_026139 [Physcomitrium patens]